MTLVASAARGVVAPAFGGGDATFVGESPVVELHCDVSIGTGIWCAPGCAAPISTQRQKLQGMRYTKEEV